jgi:opacity protein-like surface antigen
MTVKSRIALALAAIALTPLSQALGADYDPPIYVDQAPDYVPVEVGSGWYLRGDVAYLPEESYRNVDFAFTPPGYSYKESEDPVFASIGFGYHLNDYLRAEVNLGYLPGNKINVRYNDGTVAASANVKNSAMTGMVNGYVDLGTYVGFTPYVGAGVGLFRSKRNFSASYADADIPADNFALRDNKTQYSFAYSLNAGVAYQVSKNLLVDLGYQYLSSPDAEYATLADLDDSPIRKGIDSHQIKVGLRYDLW